MRISNKKFNIQLNHYTIPSSVHPDIHHQIAQHTEYLF